MTKRRDSSKKSKPAPIDGATPRPAKKARAKRTAAGKNKSRASTKKPSQTGRATRRAAGRSRTPDLTALGLGDAGTPARPAPAGGRPVKLPKRTLAAIERGLQALRAQLANGLAALTHNNLAQSGRDQAGDLSGYGYHMADVATDNFARDLELSIATGETDRLRLVEEAIERLREGTFGHCLACDRPVGAARLKVIPYARLCIGCAEEAEATWS